MNPTLQHMHQSYCPLPKCAWTTWQSPGTFQVRFSSCGPWDSYISCIRHLGAMWAWPDLLACKGAMLGVAGIDTGVTFWTAGMAEVAVVCGFRVAGIVGATGTGSMGCTGLLGAGCGTETQGLAGACGVAVVASGTVSIGLTLHSHRCCLVQW